MAETMTRLGPDSHVGYLVSVLQGSSETTFYVLAVYFGAVGVTRVRHALAAGLIADVVSVVASACAVSWLLL
jgi:spore maturation protein SpmB